VKAVPAGPVAAPTEERNPRTADIDLLPTIDILRLINAEDARVPGAIEEALPALAQAVDLAVAALGAGRRVHYFGAGSSGRMGVLDAAELGPTYALEPGRVVAHLAGGTAAFQHPMEDVEDDPVAGAADAVDVAAGDLVIGLTASGRTPYVAGVLEAARAAGARTVLVSANPDAPLGSCADVHIGVRTGPEVIAGSTRMKAGTAQKLVLNAFSTAAMVRLGRTYSNLMIQMVATNGKLRGRLAAMLVQATGLPEDTCSAALVAADGDVKVALVALLAPASADEARQALLSAGGVVRDALHRSHRRERS
jgi:N-acetylmuramic acid 6-phosphate etherase